MAQHRTAKEMYPLIERWHQSDKSKKNFCEEEQINLHTFTYWLKKYNRSKSKGNSAPSSDFVELQVENRPSITKPSPLFAEIEYPNGVALRLHHPMTSSDLNLLLQSFR